MTDNLEPSERGGVPVDGRRRGVRRVTSIGDTPRASAPDWTREHDTKAFCAHCRNWRSTRHVDEHAMIVAGGERPKGYRP